LPNAWESNRGYVGGLKLGQRNPTVVTPWHTGKALEERLKSIFGRKEAAAALALAS
jgi:hypothetical protein